MRSVDLEAVDALLRLAARCAITPRVGTLTAEQAEQKAPGELVTCADCEAEQIITQGLRDLLPDVPVVGEEAAAAEPELLGLLARPGRTWLVDPLDGTDNFLAGSPDYAVMAALVQDGQTVAGWIHRPHDGRSYLAELGNGAYRDGVRLVRQPAEGGPAQLRGAALTRFLDAPRRDRLAAASRPFATLGPGRRCAGVDYPLLAEGEQDFVLFWRTLPWDHAPGALLVTEAGGVAAHLDGRAYRPGVARAGLLAAADPATFACTRAALAGAVSDPAPAGPPG